LKRAVNAGDHHVTGYCAFITAARVGTIGQHQYRGLNGEERGLEITAVWADSYAPQGRCINHDYRTNATHHPWLF
jgi:hypothetical protein